FGERRAYASSCGRREQCACAEGVSPDGIQALEYTAGRYPLDTENASGTRLWARCPHDIDTAAILRWMKFFCDARTPCFQANPRCSGI
ncbi:MAG: hypothetical protein QF360_07825, partial [Phycisphaerales bacterium]|nr:hypothetical protein [Phycisphaerales bacterium]